jgi:hypothetical protein
MSQHVLDENIRPKHYRALKRRFSMVKVGDGFGYESMSDENIRNAMHGSKQTFHTQDRDFYKPYHRHPAYCLVFYDVRAADFVSCVQRFLRHPRFNTRNKRMGKVVRVTLEHIEVWELHNENRETVEWD